MTSIHWTVKHQNIWYFGFYRSIQKW